jgi:DNA-binding winged helix-turn-helix (wHTH) protein
MGELVDALSTRTMDASLISLFLSRGFQGLLALKMDRSYENMLFFIPATKEFLLLTRSGVTVCTIPASLQLFAFAVCLSRRLCSKGEIVRAVWNRRYQPERDDAGVYVLARRLRRLLGSHEKLLSTDRRGYSLDAEVRMWEGAESAAKDNVSSVEAESSVSSLRLLELRNWLRGRASFKAEEWQNESGISRASACRDISDLLRTGDVKKVGRGPASVYVRVDS